MHLLPYIPTWYHFSMSSLSQSKLVVSVLLPHVIVFLQNPQREVERIKQYLDLTVADDVIARIVELTSFEVIKENPMTNYSFNPKNMFDQSISPFMRKGTKQVT